MKTVEVKFLKSKALAFDNRVFGTKYDHNSSKIDFLIPDEFNLTNKYAIIKNANSNKLVAMYLLDENNSFKLTQTVTKEAGDYSLVLLLSSQVKDDIETNGINQDLVVCTSKAAVFNIADNNLTGNETIIEEDDPNYNVYFSKLEEELQVVLKQYIDDTVDVVSITEKDIDLSGYAKSEDVYSKEETYSKKEVDAIEQNVWLPSIDEEGNITWSKSTTDVPPTPSNIKGEKGDKGDQGIQGIQGIQGEQGLKGDTGADGANGYTFTPSVDTNGNLSWSNNGGLKNPSTVNIKGEKGDKGDTGEKGEKGDDGTPGSNGATFIPSVDENGNLSWSNDGGLENPSTVNIKGAKGEKGDPGVAGENYVLTDEDKAQIESNVETNVKLYVDTYILGGTF